MGTWACDFKNFREATFRPSDSLDIYHNYCSHSVVSFNVAVVRGMVGNLKIKQKSRIGSGLIFLKFIPTLFPENSSSPYYRILETIKF